MLGAVVGGDVVEERVRSATETAKRPVDGEKVTCYTTDLQRSSFLPVFRFCSGRF